MTVALLAGAAAASAALAVAGEASPRRRTLLYVFKPLATLLVLALALTRPGASGETYRTLVAVGLVLSLAGDVFLMLPRDRFVAGLVSFLLAHVAYAAAFATAAEMPRSALTLLPYLAYAAVLLRILLPHVPKPLRIPVVAYAAALLAMAWQAAERALASPPAPFAWAAAAGAALFVASDTALAVGRFVRPVPAASAVVLGTYYAAQLLIALSV